MGAAETINKVRSAIDHTKPGFHEVNKEHPAWRSTDNIRETLERKFAHVQFPFIEEDHLYGVRSDVHTYCEKHARISRLSLAGLLYGGTKYACDACAFENGSYNRKQAFKDRPFAASFQESGMFFALKKEFPDTCKGLLPDGKEIDIWVPSIHLGIEFDGNYWHTESKGRGGNYHIGKTLLGRKCENPVGITHLWSEEAIAPFTNVVNIAKLERDKPKLKQNKHTRIECVSAPEAIAFYKQWSLKHVSFANRCDSHLAVVHRGTIRAAVGFQGNTVLIVASSFYNFDLYSTLITAMKNTGGIISKVRWLCDMRIVSDTMWSHEFPSNSLKDYISPTTWKLDASAGIIGLSSDKEPSSDVVFDCGYSVFEVAI